MIDPKVKAAMVEAACAAVDIDQEYKSTGNLDELTKHWAKTALTAAMLAAEAYGYKLVGPEATDDMIASGFIAWMDASEAMKANIISIKDALNAGVAAAPGWGDGK